MFLNFSTNGRSKIVNFVDGFMYGCRSLLIFTVKTEFSYFTSVNKGRKTNLSFSLSSKPIVVAAIETATGFS